MRRRVTNIPASMGTVVAVLLLAGCSSDPKPNNQESAQTVPVQTPKTNAAIDSLSERADALIADSKRGEAEFQAANREDAQKQAAIRNSIPVVIEMPPSTGTLDTGTPHLTPAEAADVDRTKFAQIYAAGKSLEAVTWWDPASGLSVRQHELQLSERLVSFDTALSMVRDIATTNGEKTLVATYQDASARFHQWQRTPSGDKAATDSIVRGALATLAGANQIYLARN